MAYFLSFFMRDKPFKLTITKYILLLAPYEFFQIQKRYMLYIVTLMFNSLKFLP